MKDAVLFDLGNTLVRFFERSEFPAILEQSVIEVRCVLQEMGLPGVSPQVMWRRVSDENHEAADHRVRPLEGRLARIFDLDEVQLADVGVAICRAFVGPIFALAQRYEDTLPTLDRLRLAGYKTAIVSNTPWGSPADLWREELGRLGLAGVVDAVIFCRDAGWRKPARHIFELTLEELQMQPSDCLFVGDDPRWDLAGPRAIGMEAVLVDRGGKLLTRGEESIRNLNELWTRLAA
jgi:putative hydrolase of the HAD superfamily